MARAHRLVRLCQHLARAQGAAEKFVQGAWHYSGTVPGSVPGREMSFFIEWRFARGRFGVGRRYRLAGLQ